MLVLWYIKSQVNICDFLQNYIYLFDVLLDFIKSYKSFNVYWH